MIISASYRTDIPAFYGDWFLSRVAAGEARFRNPFGGGIVTVSLKPADVDGIVFWTRNFAPLIERLCPVEERGWPFVVQYTVTGYPRLLEPSVIAAEDAAAQIARLARRYGPRAAVWRYDPILLSSATGPDWHRATFARLARMLRGQVDEAVVSFVEPYRKTRRNLDRLAAAGGLEWRLPDTDEKAALVRDLAAVAGDAGMALTLCTQPALAECVAGIAAPARCIDAGRLGEVAGRPVAAPAKGNRPGCLCAAARDIGAYDTCPHGCAYCYAVADRDRAKAAYAAQDDGAEMLGVRQPKKPGQRFESSAGP